MWHEELRDLSTTSIFEHDVSVNSCGQWQKAARMEDTRQA